MVSAFVLLGFSAILSPVQAGKPGGGLTASISPKSFTTYFGCFKCTPIAVLTFAASGGTPPYTYFINWGDGQGSTVGPTTATSFTLTAYYIALAARYTVTLTVCDATNTCASATATVSVKHTGR